MKLIPNFWLHAFEITLIVDQAMEIAFKMSQLPTNSMSQTILKNDYVHVNKK